MKKKKFDERFDCGCHVWLENGQLNFDTCKLDLKCPTLKMLLQLLQPKALTLTNKHSGRQTEVKIPNATKIVHVDLENQRFN